jgi:1,4-dihydroxy-2-naphthoate octaprenyltransferase
MSRTAGDGPASRQPGEPAPGAFRNRAALYFAATRPAFLSVTGVGVMLGVACAWYELGHIDVVSGVLTLLFALLAHAGINVINDYYDAVSGTDDANVDRIFPFTGGTRFIQNGVLSRRQTVVLGYALLALVVPGGLLLTLWSGPGLLWVGLAGLLVGWAYSASPLKLNSRGLGEICVAAGFLCVVVGTDYVQRHGWDSTPFGAGIPYALLVTNLLFINQFPDRKADLHAGKLHWVARLPPRVASWGYVAIAIAAAWLLTTSALARDCLPPSALVALVALVPAAFAARVLLKHADSPAVLAPAIKATIVAAILFGLVLSAVLVVSR